MVKLQTIETYANFLYNNKLYKFNIIILYKLKCLKIKGGSDKKIRFKNKFCCAKVKLVCIQE